MMTFLLFLNLLNVLEILAYYVQALTHIQDTFLCGFHRGRFALDPAILSLSHSRQLAPEGKFFVVPKGSL